MWTWLFIKKAKYTESKKINKSKIKKSSTFKWENAGVITQVRVLYIFICVSFFKLKYGHPSLCSLYVVVQLSQVLRGLLLLLWLMWGGRLPQCSSEVCRISESWMAVRSPWPWKWQVLKVSMRSASPLGGEQSKNLM